MAGHNYSEVDICNNALAMVGAKGIRSIDEDTKRARVCGIFYPMMRDYLLARFDWPFARKLVNLKQPSKSDLVRYHFELDTLVPEGWYAYVLPNDCLAPRDLHPPGNREKWQQIRDIIICRVPIENKPQLWYTARVENTTQFSMQFVNLLALGIATKIAPTIAADKNLTQQLVKQFNMEQAICFGDDANVGVEPDPDNSPYLDSFVDPDASAYLELGLNASSPSE